MKSLKVGESHSWDKGKFANLELQWADSTNPGMGTVSVKLGNGAATSFTVPQAAIDVNQQAGKLTNNTTKTIQYELS
jgi:hypothetical protein